MGAWFDFLETQSGALEDLYIRVPDPVSISEPQRRLGIWGM
jgi:hypothetical protein